jgi:hypothetical protein
VVLASVLTVLLVNYFMPKKLAITIFLSLYRIDTLCILDDGLTRCCCAGKNLLHFFPAPGLSWAEPREECRMGFD